MMNRIDKTLTQLRSCGKKMLSPYITAGDPKPEMTVTLMHELVKVGANVLELGIPFSDPMAEGPVIQAAMERALAYDISCEDVFTLVQEFRIHDAETPIVLMGYLNPIEQYGYEKFAKRAEQVGVDGTIIVDLPPEESAEIAAIWQAHGIYNIYLCSPTTSDDRMVLINQYARGYLYYVSLKGVTGADTFDLNSVKAQYQHRQSQSELPMMIGFGIKTPTMASEVSRFADGVIVGAALIECIQNTHSSSKEAILAGAALLSGMRDAMDNNGTTL